ncbi:M18 family aminopeptidase [Ruania zhangjianzhongii]|uniref:M18 family aminopeptidase n=1 Tax=Ruania zhangjianzhongii TaxID=2603206 RepID=UPI0011C999F5|nr:M18 family aminopeptidase [Ruania zhangjianzhongii]
MDQLAEYIDDLAAFITASPSSYHAAAEAARRLDDDGFTPLAEDQEWPAQPGGYYVLRDGALIAWLQPAAAGPTTPFRVLGAHTDSPGFKLKPRPSTGSRGWLQAGVEVYGGPLLNSWLDRELELAGRIVLRDGTQRLVRTGPMLRIPQLAIHLDREVNNGLALDKQRHVQPVWGAGEDGDLLGVIGQFAGVDAAEIGGYDLLTADTQAPARFGHDAALFAAGRMDNLVSVHAGVRALIAAAHQGGAGGQISVLAAFDHEELGSQTRSGASGPILDDVLTRVEENLGATRSQQRQAYAGSWCLSADCGHAVHPNYPERHDPANQPVAGGGVLLKINANQRYATDATGAALMARLAARSGAPVQEFVSNNTVPCGSTIGPLTATRLGIRTVDVGVPLLSMHSARELVHTADAVALGDLAGAFFAGA